MDTYRKEKLTALLFVIVLAILFLGMFWNAKIVGKEFFSSYHTMEADLAAQGRTNLMLHKSKAAVTAMEGAVDKGVLGRDAFIELFSTIYKLADKRIVSDVNYGAVYKTKYDQLSYAVYPKDITYNAQMVIELKEDLEKKGIPFLYVQAPFKLPPDELQLPVEGSDYSNYNADNFLTAIETCGVDALDLRKGFWDSGLSQNELFFDTDHHWTGKGALLATGTLEEFLNENYGFNIDTYYRNPNNFKETVYEQCFIGSLGRRVGKAFGGVDDFTLVEPDFDTDITLYEREGINVVTERGRFEDVVLEMEFLDPEAPLDTNRYRVYHGDNEELVFTNHQQDSGRILLIKDSFALPVYCFLSLGVNEVRALDIRLFMGDVAEYAGEYQPDLVILMYNADGFNDSMYNFKAKH